MEKTTLLASTGLFLSTILLHTLHRNYALQVRNDEVYERDVAASASPYKNAGLTLAALEELLEHSALVHAHKKLSEITILDCLQIIRNTRMQTKRHRGLSYCEHLRRLHYMELKCHTGTSVGVVAGAGAGTETAACVESYTGEANVFVSYGDPTGGGSSEGNRCSLSMFSAISALRAQCATLMKNHQHNGVNNILGTNHKGVRGTVREWYFYWDVFSEPLRRQEETSSSLSITHLKNYSMRQHAILEIGHVMLLLPFLLPVSSPANADVPDAGTYPSPSPLSPLRMGSLTNPSQLLDYFYISRLARLQGLAKAEIKLAEKANVQRKKKEQEDKLAAEKAARRLKKEQNIEARRRHSLVSSGGGDISVEHIGSSSTDQNLDNLSGAPVAAPAAPAASQPVQPEVEIEPAVEQLAPAPASASAPALELVQLWAPSMHLNYRVDFCTISAIGATSGDERGLQQLCMSGCGESYDGICRWLVQSSAAIQDSSDIYNPSSVYSGSSSDSGSSSTGSKPCKNYGDVGHALLAREFISLRHAASVAASDTDNATGADDVMQLIATAIRQMHVVPLKVNQDSDYELIQEVDIENLVSLFQWLKAAALEAIQLRKAAASVPNTDRAQDMVTLFRLEEVNTNFSKWAYRYKSAISMYRVHGMGMVGARKLASVILQQILQNMPGQLEGEYVHDTSWLGESSGTNCSASAIVVKSSTAPEASVHLFIQDYIPFKEAKYSVHGELLVSPYSVQLHIRIGSILLNLVRSRIEGQVCKTLDQILRDNDCSPIRALAGN